jgi:hypothetical protein
VLGIPNLAEIPQLAFKYETPRGGRNHLYIPGRTRQRLIGLGQRAQTIIITEGEKKALKADQVFGAPDQRGFATDEIAAGRLAPQNAVATLREHAPERCAEAADVPETQVGSPRPQESRGQGHPGEPCPALQGVAVMRYVRADGSRGAWTTELDPEKDTYETLRARFLEAFPDGETSLIELALRPLLPA